MIPEAAVDAAFAALFPKEPTPSAFKSAVWEPTIRTILEAAAPHLLVHVHHHDIEHHARSFNEGYETAVTQGLADDPTLADDWLNAKLAEAWDRAVASLIYDDGTPVELAHNPNPYRG